MSVAARLQDPLALAQALMACPSITPEDAGALDCLQEHLRELGFVCHRLPFEAAGTPKVDNLFAQLGEGSPHLCFAGHTDVVPVGDAAAWTHPPFAPTVQDGKLWGRGASDMKGAVAAFAAACAQYCAAHGKPPQGSVSLMITGDEEGPAINGTAKILDWLQAKNTMMDHCLVGEPSNPNHLGEMIKVGRRGSTNGTLTVRGRQGHVAYPHLAHNPVPQLLALLQALQTTELDKGTEYFQPSNLEVVAIDIPNRAFNVIPAWAQARFNIRYNDTWKNDALEAWVRATLDRAAKNTPYELEFIANGDWFLTPANEFVTLVQDSVEAVVGRRPELSTAGGTSDGRFICRYAPVLEFGPLNKTIHQVDEHIAVADLTALTKIYLTILERYFASPPPPPPPPRSS